VTVEVPVNIALSNWRISTKFTFRDFIAKLVIFHLTNSPVCVLKTRELVALTKSRYKALYSSVRAYWRLCLRIFEVRKSTAFSSTVDWWNSNNSSDINKLYIFNFVVKRIWVTSCSFNFNLELNSFGLCCTFWTNVRVFLTNTTSLCILFLYCWLIIFIPCLKGANLWYSY
jgi:hypothetical protein